MQTVEAGHQKIAAEKGAEVRALVDVQIFITDMSPRRFGGSSRWGESDRREKRGFDLGLVKRSCQGIEFSRALADDFRIIAGFWKVGLLGFGNDLALKFLVEAV